MDTDEGESLPPEWEARLPGATEDTLRDIQSMLSHSDQLWGVIDARVTKKRGRGKTIFVGMTDELASRLADHLEDHADALAENYGDQNDRNLAASLRTSAKQLRDGTARREITTTSSSRSTREKRPVDPVPMPNGLTGTTARIVLRDPTSEGVEVLASGKTLRVAISADDPDMVTS
jgi:predicted GIY-YIG superfamily endonuclease